MQSVVFVNFGLQHTDVWQVSVLFRIVKAVTDNKSVGNVEAEIVCLDIGLAALGLVKQRDNADGSRFSCAEVLGQVTERNTAVQNILDNNNMAVFDHLIQILQNILFLLVYNYIRLLLYL